MDNLKNLVHGPVVGAATLLIAPKSGQAFQEDVIHH